MNTMVAKVRNALVAASVMGAVAFGGMQALATPAQAAETETCNQNSCNRQCEAQFGPFAAGYCENGECLCAV